MALIEKLENIGNAIRSKTGKEDLLTLDEMATEISNIETGGGDTNWSLIGYDKTPDFVKNGYDYAVQIKESWTSSNNYSSKFSNDKSLIFMPFVDTSTGTNFSSMFNSCSNLIDIPDLDTSKGTSFGSMFMYCSLLKKVPKIDTSKGTNFNRMFMYDSVLEIIPKIDTSNGIYFGDMFFNCKNVTALHELDGSNAIGISTCFGNMNKLENFGGFKNIGKAYTVETTNNIPYRLSFQNSTLLTHDSLMNIIDKLYDLNVSYNVANGGTLYTQKLTLGSTNIAKLTAEEIAIATSKGWSMS